MPDKPALIMSRTGEVITYRRLDERSNQAAHLFRSLGLRPGDCMAILSRKSSSIFRGLLGSTASRALLHMHSIQPDSRRG
jgi:long-chain acyl-CoA synthetase